MDVVQMAHDSVREYYNQQESVATRQRDARALKPRLSDAEQEIADEAFILAIEEKLGVQDGQDGPLRRPSDAKKYRPQRQFRVKGGGRFDLANVEEAEQLIKEGVIEEIL